MLPVSVSLPTQAVIVTPLGPLGIVKCLSSPKANRDAPGISALPTLVVVDSVLPLLDRICHHIDTFFIACRPSYWKK